MRCAGAQPHRAGLPLAAGVLAALAAHSTAAGTMTLDVKTKQGAAAENTLVVFDPLDATPAPSRGVVVIDQIDKKFVPKVSIIRTGTAATFPNSDRIRHQVYSFSAPKPFTLKLYAGSPHVEVSFDKPGLVILGCNIHDSMVAYVGIVDTPYFVKIGSSGTASLNLPAGHYRLRVWHPALATDIVPRTISVGSEDGAMQLDVDLDPSRVAAAAWPE